MHAGKSVAIVGAGLAGNLLALMLARRGCRVTVYERQPGYQANGVAGGRSINLALAARGIRALQQFEAFAAIEPLLLPMAGRQVHPADAPPRFAPYGTSSDERIYSVSRMLLNQRLYELAAQHAAVSYIFDTRCEGIDADSLQPILRQGTRALRADTDIVIAADGAGSPVRRSLMHSGLLTGSEALLDHGYKELEIAPGPGGEFQLAPEALHIWPRGHFMLIALPNLDRSFTATLFLPQTGPESFAAIEAAAGPDAFGAWLRHHFPDVAPLIGAPEQQFTANPVGRLGTVHCAPWSWDGRLLLLGDAAHAIVPFHGQGMNAAFEDIRILANLLDDNADDWRRALPQFEQVRRPNAEAIAGMALENYEEMRARVLDAGFMLRRELALALERRAPDVFTSRYSMVMFHPEISYAEARHRGALQEKLLRQFTAGCARLEDVDLAGALEAARHLPR